MGKIELDHTGSGGGVTLSSDGTDLLLDGTAIGGGGGAALELYAENYDGTSTKPSATGTNTIAIGQSAVAGNADDGIAIGRGANCGTATQNIAIGAFSDCGFNSFAMALGRLAQATGGSSLALGVDSAASHDKSVAIGKSNSNGDDSFAAQIVNNTTSYGAQGNNSIAMGSLSKATGGGSCAIGQAAQATTNYAYSIGFGSLASGNYSFSAGRDTTASARGTVALGEASLASIQGKMSFAASRFTAQGDAQSGTFVLRSDTTDATPEALTTSNSAAGTTNQVILPNNSAYAFHGTIVARQQASAGTASAAWKVEGLIRREGSAGTTVLVNSATTVLDNTPAWGMALSANTTRGGLAITVTGAASTNIRWVSTIHTTEVTYA